MKKILLKSWPLFATALVVGTFFWKVFLLGQVPIPGDFIVGAYYPWLDYKWGYQVGVPVKNPITSDVVSIIYPLRSYAANVLKQGRLPLWNPFMFNGSPLHADFQVGIFSPTIIFYFIFSKIWAWAAQIMIQPILAVFFTYLLLRNFGLKKIESLFGGFFYAFSSFNIIWMEWNTNTLAAAFIPLTILFLDKLIHSSKLYWGALLSISICLQIFSGYPQLVIFTMGALFIFVTFRFKDLTGAKVLRVIFFILIGVLLSSILTIPGSEFILNSERRFGILSYDLVYLPWRNLVTLLAPDYFGNPATGNYFGGGNYAINAGYSGVIVLCLAIIGVLKEWGKKEVKYFVSLFLLALLLALPTPFAKALFYSPIPGVSLSSNTRILVLANLSLAVLAGFGISNLLKNERIKKLGFVFIPFLILIGLYVLTSYISENHDVSLRNLILPIALSALTSGAIIIREKLIKFGRLRFLLVLALCLVAVMELIRYGWKYTPFSKPELVFPETPVISYLMNEKEPFRISTGNVIPMNMWVPYGLESVSGYDALYPIWWARLYSAINRNDPRDSVLSYYAPFEKYENRWFDLLNNKYLMILNPQGPSDNSSAFQLIDKIQQSKKFVKVFQDKSVAIYKNNDVFPRAFFVSDWDRVSDDEVLSILINPTFPLEKKIIISKDTNLNKSKDPHSEVSYDFYSPEKSILNVTTDKEGFLFVSDAWYPGWKARVDGEAVDIFRADYAFRAVPVESGVHKIEFIYDPESLKVGKLLSLITALFLIGVLIYDRRNFA